MKLAWTLIAVLVLTGCSKEPPPYESRYTEPADTKPVAVTVIGDSFTAGTEYGGQGGAGWPMLAAVKLRGQGVDVAMARPAQEGAGWVEPNSKGTVFATEVKGNVSEATSLVVLFGSLNDGSIPPEVLTPAVVATLADVKAAAPNARLLVIGPPTLGRGTPEKPGKMPAVRDAVKAGADAAGAVFVDPIAENWFSDPAFIGADGVHPSDAGHQMMAEKIAPLITTLLQQP